MGGIGVERYIGQDADVRHRILDRADGAAHEVVGVERFLPIIAAPVSLGVGEKGEAGDASVTRFAGAGDDAVHRPARHAGQRGDGLFHPLPFRHEERPDEVAGVQAVFGVHRAAPGGGASAAQAERRIGSVGHRRGLGRADHPIKVPLPHAGSMLGYAQSGSSPSWRGPMFHPRDNARRQDPLYEAGGVETRP